MEVRMRFKDISSHENTFVKKIKDELIEKLGNMSYDEAKEKFLSCLNDPDVAISKEAKNRYLQELEKKKTLTQLQSWIYNIYLKASGKGTF